MISQHDLPTMHSPTQRTLLSLQEFGNRAGAFPPDPAKLVGAKVSNTFDTEDGPVVFGGRVTEYLFARITGQGMTPLCAPSDEALHLLYLNRARMPTCLQAPVVGGQTPANIYRARQNVLL
jgi:hypothetical protein